MTKIVLIGNGWRANYFQRIAKEVSNEFEIVAVVTRSEEKAAEVTRLWNVYATPDWDAALAVEHDYVILCVTRSATESYLEKLMQRGEKILCETPPGYTLDALKHVWEMKEQYDGKIQISEQYQFWPLYSSCMNVIEQGVLGPVSNMTLSVVHGYHAVSLYRKFLQIGFEDCVIRGKRYAFDVTYTMGRPGYDESGEVISANRDMITLEFEGGKTAFYDFCEEQYFSPIRTRRMNIQGVRGEIDDLTVRYLNQKNRPVTMPFQRLDDGLNNIQGWSHQGMMFGEDFVYRNVFPGAKLNDDEIGIATGMRLMKRYADTGEEFYGLEEGLQDAYLSLLMDEALKNPGQEIRTTKQPWQK